MNNENNQQPEQKIRVKLPRNREVIGLIDQRVGGSRMLVKCSDGKVRNCKVPGRLRRSLWIREGDYVIVEPWEFDDEKGDILFKYNPNEIRILRERNLLNGIDSEF
ncbi:MAG: translation initiation factor eIF-1A [Candidatus Pacearchaeota archaeon]|jgi:translation initiation factor 1A